jgi:hypothetical protein
MTMTSKDTEDWKNLYLAAVLESDKNLLPHRIFDARTAILRRGRKLFHSGTASLGERQALDRALYALNALTSCLQIDTSRVAA